MEPTEAKALIVFCAFWIAGLMAGIALTLRRK